MALSRSWRGWNATASARDLFERLAVVEDRHAARWEELFREAGRPLPPTRRRGGRGRSRGSRGPSARRPSCRSILAEEGREVQAYLGLARQSTQPADAPRGGRHRRRFGGPRARAVRGHGPRRGAVARRRRRRHAAQHRLRLQRRTDRELRSGRRRHRRQRLAAHRHRHAASPARSPTRCRWDRADISRPRARRKCRRTRSRWSARRCGSCPISRKRSSR